MRLLKPASLLSAVALGAVAVLAQTAPQASPWNGTWVLNEQRSMPGAKGQAADDYRFTVGPGDSILWEIPSLHEVVQGHIDGRPMEIHRPSLKEPMTLSLTADGPQVLIYQVSRNGKPVGAGRMTLVENNTGWVDISGPADQPQLSGMLLYSRKK